MRKIAVFFPGIGYTVDKPLMYYSRKLAIANGYEVKLLPYHGFPNKIMGNQDKMIESFNLAWSQTMEMLKSEELDGYDEILFVGKSVGTVVAAKYASECKYKDRIRMILYTPLEYTFKYPFSEAVVFTGNNDPWVGLEKSRIEDICKERNIPVEVFDRANHSLETGDVNTDLEYIRDIMKKTQDYIAG